MTPKGSKQYEYMLQCLERAAKAASEEERRTLLFMASTYERGDILLRKSLIMIAESRELLWRLDRSGALRGKAAIPGAVSLGDNKPPPPRNLADR